MNLKPPPVTKKDKAGLDEFPQECETIRALAYKNRMSREFHRRIYRSGKSFTRPWLPKREPGSKNAAIQLVIAVFRFGKRIVESIGARRHRRRGEAPKTNYVGPG